MYNKYIIHQGVSVELEDPHEGISLTEIKEGEPSNIRLEIGTEGGARFVGKSALLAAELSGFQIKRLYRPKSNGSVAFFYAIKGDFDGATVEMLNSLTDMLKSAFESDYDLKFLPFEPTMCNVLKTRLDMKYRVLYVYYEMKFAKPWAADSSFQEVK